MVEDTGLDWLQYACKRWLHEECTDYDIGNDADGNDLLCPFALFECIIEYCDVYINSNFVTTLF